VSIGAFKYYRVHFPISERTLGKLKGIARDVFDMGQTGTGNSDVIEKHSDQIDPAVANSEMFADVFGQLETVDPWLTWSSNLAM
jgi:hypothetical protein